MVIKINESDFTKVRKSLKEYLNTSGSPFENYNFETSGLSGMLDFGSSIIQYLSYQMNRSVSEIFMNTALLDETVYTLMSNFNYLPFMRKPAKKYMKIRYNLNSTATANSSTDSYTLTLNNGLYTDDYKMIPTFRDKWQSTDYEDANPNAFLNQNVASFNMDHIEVGGIKYAQAIIPMFQAEWDVNEYVAVSGFDNTYFLRDGSGDSYNDKVVADTIRVFVKELDTNWYEYSNIRDGLFDENERSYNLTYDQTNGLTVVMGIDRISRELEIGETLRIFFAVTEGEDINTVSGSSTFNNTKYETIKVYNDTDSAYVLESEGGDGTTATVSTGTAGLLETFLLEEIDTDSDSAIFDNGAAMQTLASIKTAAPLFLTTQGRVVTEQDYNTVLQAKFTEYGGIYAWSGGREFIDIEQMLTDNIGAGTTFTLAQCLTAMKSTMEEMNTGNDFVIDMVSYNDLQDGKYVKDKGWVYVTYYNDGFKFARSTANDTEIETFLSNKKILTIFQKFMNPNFCLLKPEITVKAASAYSSEISSLTTKQKIRDFVNDNVEFNQIFNTNDIYDYLVSLDEIDQVSNISFTVKDKFKNNDDDDYIYVRLFTPIAADLNTKLTTADGTEVADITSSGTVVSIDGTVAGDINKSLGLMRFKTTGNVTSNSSYTELYIKNISITGNRIYAFRENIVGIEGVADIKLVIE